MRGTSQIAAAAVIAAGLYAGSASAQTTIKADTWLSTANVMNATILPWWAKAVEEGTQGRVKVTMSYPPNPNPSTFFDRITDGISDVMWSFHGYNPGRFVLTQIVEIPGLDADAYEATVAYQRIHEKFLAKADEHKGIKVLTVFSHGPGLLHTRAPITSIEQFKGLKVRNGGGVGAEISNLLGFTQVPAPASKVYEIVSQGVADGTLMPIESKEGFKLKEVAPYSLVFPGGFYYGSFWIGMNIDKYNKLSKADQAAIDKASGDPLAEITGRGWKKADDDGMTAAKAAGNTITVASGALAQELRSRLAGFEKDWIERASKKGVDGRAALDALRAEVQKVKKKS
jgi:TRAP-type C4-dicarboxylate transport system substrate-binding protein